MAQFYNQYKSEHITEHITDTTAISIHQAQQKIYNFFLEIIKHNRPEEILNQFDRLFIKYEEIPDLNAYYALGEIIFHNREHEFKNTLLRCCYILNNNWALNGKINACHQLVELFLSDSIAVPTRISRLKTLKQWLRNFAQSEEYQTLRSLLGKSRAHKTYHNWSDRFSSYLLTSEYIDFNKSPEQRQYAETLSRKLKKQFKFDLAMYTARLGSSSGSNPQRQNPTTLGDGVLMLIKKVLNKQGSENFRNTAKNFIRQIRYMTLLEFKENLLEYLGISKDDLEIPEVMRVTVVQKLKHLQKNEDNQKMTISFLHVACNRVLQYLLLNERRSPSEFLMLSLEYNNYLNPVILLLKTVLICPSSRLYLESYIAELIKFYSSYSEIECQSFINFVDVLNVTLAIFDEDTNYSLIKMQNNPNNTNNLPDVNLESYRIFSQSKRLADLRIAPAKSDTTRSLHPSV